jgi:hypothetical protein
LYAPLPCLLSLFPAHATHISPAQSSLPFYHHGHYDAWIWDSRIAVKLFIDAFAEHASLCPLVDDFTTASQHFQRIANVPA